MANYDEGYRDGYRMGYEDGSSKIRSFSKTMTKPFGKMVGAPKGKKRKLNSWQKFVKANSKKRKFRFKDGKLKLKSMGIAYRKTAAYKRSKK